jgi:hypothetical protein
MGSSLSGTKHGCAYCDEIDREGRQPKRHAVIPQYAFIIGAAIVAIAVIAVALVFTLRPHFGAPSEFSAASGNLLTTLKWSNNSEADQVLIRCKTTGYPVGPTDGNLVYQGLATSFIHKNLDYGNTYYYGIWSVRTVNSVQQYSKAASASASPTWVGPNGEDLTETLPVRGATHTITLHNNPRAIDPTWSHLLTFLASDRTDWHTYDYGSFVCADYAEVLHNNAEIAGIRAGYVTLGLDGDPFAHAANVFNTTDRGLIYVDDTRPIGSYPCSADTTVVVSAGQQYIPKLISPCPGYSSTFLSMGTVTGVTPYW